jgi:undecaprenyl-diphosphatase
VPAALAGFFLSSKLDNPVFGTKVLPFMFLLTAALLAATEFLTRRRIKVGGNVGIKSAAAMGFAQAVAIIPGLSRSGSTICAGVLSGAQREKAARFSFFMSIPIILGSAAYSLVKGGKDAFGDISIVAVAAGMAAAAVAGFFAIKLMLKLISKSNYKWFAVYLAAISIAAFIYGY